MFEVRKRYSRVDWSMFHKQLTRDQTKHGDCSICEIWSSVSDPSTLSTSPSVGQVEVFLSVWSVNMESSTRQYRCSSLSRSVLSIGRRFKLAIRSYLMYIHIMLLKPRTYLSTSWTPALPVGGASPLHPFTTFSKYESGAAPGKTFNRSRRLCRNVFLGNMPETALRTIYHQHQLPSQHPYFVVRIVEIDDIPPLDDALSYVILELL